MNRIILLLLFLGNPLLYSQDVEKLEHYVTIKSSGTPYFSPDGKFLLLYYRDEIDFYDIDSGDFLFKLDPPPSVKKIMGLQYSDDAKRIVAMYDESLIAWNFVEKEWLQDEPYKVHTYWVESLLPGPDRDTYISASQDQTFCVFNFRTKKAISAKMPERLKCEIAFFSNDGKRIYAKPERAGGADRDRESLQVYDYDGVSVKFNRNLEKIPFGSDYLKNPVAPIYSCSPSRSEIVMMNVEKLTFVKIPAYHEEVGKFSIRESMVFTPDGNFLVCSRHFGGTSRPIAGENLPFTHGLEFFNMAGSLRRSVALEFEPQKVAFSKDGRLVAISKKSRIEGYSTEIYFTPDEAERIRKTGKDLSSFRPKPPPTSAVIVGFLEAVAKNDLDAVKLYIEKGLDVNRVRGNRGRFRKGFEVSDRKEWNRETPLSVAIAEKHVSMIHYLLDQGASISDLEGLECLFDSDPNDHSLADTSQEFFEVFKLCIDKSTGEKVFKVLQNAITDDVLRVRLSDSDYDKIETQLKSLKRRRQIEAIKYMAGRIKRWNVEETNDVNLIAPSGTRHTLLTWLYAKEYGVYSVLGEDVKMALIDAGVPLDGPTNATMLFAVAYGDRYVVAALKKNGADINKVIDSKGNTLLTQFLATPKGNRPFSAIIQGARTTSVTFLQNFLREGADASHKNRDGKTAYDLALENGKSDEAKVLKAHLK